VIVVRNVFQLHFGKAKEGLALLKEGVEIQKRAGADYHHRLLTDLTGPFYTLVLEITLPNVAALEMSAPRAMADKDWQANYQKFSQLVHSGYREIFTVAE
jgi:hypothetical protein